MLLDFELSLLTENGEQLMLAKRARQKLPAEQPKSKPREAVHFLGLKTATYEAAKKVARGFDVYAIEEIWRSYCQKKDAVLDNPDRAFIGFCRAYVKKNPIPAR